MANKTMKVEIVRGVVFNDGKRAVDLLPAEKGKKPNIVELPEDTAKEFIFTGHAVAVDSKAAAADEEKKK